MESIIRPTTVFKSTDEHFSPSLNGHTNGLDRAQSEPYFDAAAIVSSPLDDAHRAQLEKESAISEAAITARSYFSTDDRNALKFLGFAPSVGRCLIIPTYNYRGARGGFIARPDIPTAGKKYLLPKGATAVLDIAPLTAADIGDPAKPLIITEGAKKADAAASQGLCAINLNGVYGFRGTNANGGITALADWENIALKSRVVYIAYDSDVAIKASIEIALRRLCAFLIARGAIVKVIYLLESKSGEKTGLDDFFARGGTVPELFSMARDLESETESKRKKKEARNAEFLERLRADGLPIIETCARQQSDALRELSEAIEKHNAGTRRLFRGTGGLGLVRIEEESAGQPRLRIASRDAMRGIAGDVARWISTNEREGVRDVAPPRDLCDVYLAMPESWRGVPIIEGTATAPFFAADGVLCATNGYHESARTWLSLPARFEMPDTTPTRENIAAAKRLILGDILGEVAFADAASKSHAVAQMILPFVRRLIDGATPLHLWSAPLRGSGKSYAASACIMPFATPTPTPEKSSPEEWRKSLICELVTGPSHIFIDNIKGALNSSALDLAITEGSVRDRLTGTGEVVTAHIKCVWVATANNAELTEDAATRTLVIRLDPNSENPDRREFASDPKAFIKANRARVCGAILTLVRAWQVAGAPSYAGPHRWRFPHWQNVIGGILEVNGIEGFLDNLESERESLNTGGDDWADLVALWHEAHGENYVTAQELLPLAEKVTGVAAQLEKTEGAQRARKFMSLVRARRDRVYGNSKITAGPKINRQSSYKLNQKIHTAHTAHTPHYNAQFDVNAGLNVETELKQGQEKHQLAPYSDGSAQTAQCAAVETAVLS